MSGWFVRKFIIIGKEFSKYLDVADGVSHIFFQSLVSPLQWQKNKTLDMSCIMKLVKQ
jgi:hypothetical protein